MSRRTTTLNVYDGSLNADSNLTSTSCGIKPPTSVYCLSSKITQHHSCSFYSSHHGYLKRTAPCSLERTNEVIKSHPLIQLWFTVQITGYSPGTQKLTALCRFFALKRGNDQICQGCRGLSCLRVVSKKNALKCFRMALMEDAEPLH